MAGLTVLGIAVTLVTSWLLSQVANHDAKGEHGRHGVSTRHSPVTLLFNQVYNLLRGLAESLPVEITQHRWY